MKPSDIKTWRERAGLADSYTVHSPSTVERAMQEEIADLRACLALRAAEPVTSVDPRQLDIFGNPA